MELWDSKVEVMGGDVYANKLLRITGKAGEEIFAPFKGMSYEKMILLTRSPSAKRALRTI